MNTTKTLVELSREGELGKLLLEKFGGEQGHTHQNQDVNFLIVFGEQEKIPTAEAVREAVLAHYTTLGFRVEDKGTQEKCFQGMVWAKDPEDQSFTVCITTNYPFDGHHRCLRATTDLVG